MTSPLEPNRPSQRRYRFLLVSLVLVMAGAAFALGIGVMGLLDDDGAAAASGRWARPWLDKLAYTPSMARSWWPALVGAVNGWWLSASGKS